MKDYIIYCIKEEYKKTEEMCAGIGAYSEEEVFHQIGNLIHWLMDYFERFDRTCELSERKKEIIHGIKFICNCLKHNKEIIDLKDKLPGFTTFPFKLDGTGRFYCYVWADLSYLPVYSYHHKDQYEAYMKMCKGNPVILIFRECMEILDPNLVDEWVN